MKNFMSNLHVSWKLHLIPLIIAPFIFGLAISAYQRNAALIVLFTTLVLAVITLNLLILKRMIVKPIKDIEDAAKKVSEGDLSFDVGTGSADEIGTVATLLKGSFHTLEGVLHRIKELSGRIMSVADGVGKEAEKVIDGAETEAEATGAISSSVEQLNATAAGIADNTEGLAASALDASASIEEMASSIKSINGNIHELNTIVETTSASIDELTAAIKEVAANSDDLSGASEETISAIAEITAVIKEVDSSAKDSASLSEKVTSDAVTLGMASIEKTIDGMRDIEASVKHTSECIAVLGSRSKDIEMMLRLIQEVTEETTLLSLNAAILAAQAGEHGKGFSVVATEIKSLAKRTEASTKDIASLIRTIQNELENATSATKKGISSAEAGMRLAQNAGDALKKVLDSSRRSSEMTLSIKRSTEEQARAAGMVTDATERIRSMIDHIAKATSEQSHGVVLIMKAAEKMKYLSQQVSNATQEQEMSSRQIAEATEFVSERSRQIANSLAEHKKASQNILDRIEAVKDIPVENRELAFRISKTLWNLKKDAELLDAEIEHFKFSEKKGVTLTFGVVPLKDPSEMFRKFLPLSEYLTRKIGRKVDLRVAIDMENAINDIGTNVTQLCAMGPANYIEARTRFGVRVLVKALRQGKPFHRAAIVSKAGSGILSSRNLKGKTFAFVSPKSATGHIAPLAALKEAGIKIQDLRNYRFLGSHERVAEAVLSGEFEAGGLMEETAFQYKEKGLNILDLSPEVPEFNVCCSPSLDESTMKVIKDAFMALDISKPEDSLVLQSLGKDCTGFVPATESDYDIFKEKILGLESEASVDSYIGSMRNIRSRK